MTTDAPQTDVIGQALAEKAVAAARAAEEAKRDSFLLGLMRNAQGREFVWSELLDGGGLFRDCRQYRTDLSTDCEGTAIAYAEGARARATWNRLWDACPSAVAAMVGEAASRIEAAKAHQ